MAEAHVRLEAVAAPRGLCRRPPAAHVSHLCEKLHKYSLLRRFDLIKTTD